MLVEADDGDFEALLGGRARASFALEEGNVASAEELIMLRALAGSIAQVFTPVGWLMVEQGEVAGLCSVVRVDAAERAIEIGYGVAASCRGRGIAGRAIADIVRWARADARVDAVTADTSVTNPGSQRVLERAGFARVGTRTDPEDGEMICWRVATKG